MRQEDILFPSVRHCRELSRNADHDREEPGHVRPKFRSLEEETVLLVALSCLFVVVFGAVSWWALRVLNVDVRNWAGASLLVLWVAGVGAKALYDNQARDAGNLESLASAAGLAPAGEEGWPADAARAAGAETSGVTGQVMAGKGAAGPIGSVESFIAPLEARLENQPDDAKGWALLAQSYAFIGNDAGAEKAISRAAALGMDADALRERVAAVHRENSHPDLAAAPDSAARAAAARAGE